MIFNRSGSSDVEYFLFYSENVASVETEGEERARAFITYLGSEAFRFYFKCSTKLWKLTEEATNYDFVEQVFDERLRRKQTIWDVIESMVSMKMEKMKRFSPSLTELPRFMEKLGSQMSKSLCFHQELR